MLDNSVSDVSQETEVEKATNVILNSKEKVFKRVKTIISESTETNSANLKVTRSN